MKPIFVKTRNAKGFINLIHNLKNKSDNVSKIGLVYGNAGLGKTKTALYLSIQYDAIYIRATNSMSPKWMLEEIAKEHPEICVCKVNVDNEQALAIDFKVMYIPTIAVIKNGEVVHKSSGLKTKPQLLELLGLN